MLQLRWHIGDMEKYLKYRCYYVLRAHVEATACARKTITWPRKRYCVRT